MAELRITFPADTDARLTAAARALCLSRRQFARAVLIAVLHKLDRDDPEGELSDWIFKGVAPSRPRCETE